jgi:hypothetical protein
MKKYLAKLSNAFDQLPSKIKVMYFVFSSSLLTLVVDDLMQLKLGVYNPYLLLVLNTVINLLQYLILQIGIQTQK